MTSIIFNINLENFTLKIITYIISGILTKIFVSDMWKMWKSRIKNKELYCKLIIDKKEINAFIDTGNNVHEPLTGLDVIFLDQSLIKKFNIEKYKKIQVEVSTVNGKDIKTGYIIKNIIVKRENNEIVNIPKAVICFSLTKNTSLEKYSAIIGYDIYLKIINGGVRY